MNIHPVAAFSDNYIWTMIKDGNAAVVDPGDAAPVEQYLAAQRLQLVAILITHHHFDHTGGVANLLRNRDIPVYGPAAESIDHLTRRLVEGDSIEVMGRHFAVLEVPGHTAGHIAYHSERPDPPVLFCGDTLFSGGCGRLFEGTPAQMHRSLSKLGALKPQTQVFCTHEYTLSNLAFANAVEPDNSALADYSALARALRDDNCPTLPSTIGLERQINPFLRTAEDSVIAAARTRGLAQTSPEAVLGAIREWKDQF